MQTEHLEKAIGQVVVSAVPQVTGCNGLGSPVPTLSRRVPALSLAAGPAALSQGSTFPARTAGTCFPKDLSPPALLRGS